MASLNLDAVRDGIAATNKIFMATFAKEDAAGVAALYTEDGQFMPSNSDFVIGRQAIQATFQGLLDMGIKGIKLETIEVEVLGDSASEVGRYILEAEGGQVADQGKFLVIWKQEAGQWKLHRDMINTSMPAAG